MLGRKRQRARFEGDPTTYWEARYALGGNSGHGSGGHLAEFKAEVLGALFAELGTTSVIDFGCGDGRQLALMPSKPYVGLDVSPTILRTVVERFHDDATKSFFLYDPHEFVDRERRLSGDLALSMDVVFHLTDDDVYKRYLAHLFAAADRHVLIYSSNREEPYDGSHVRHRAFVADVERDLGEDWHLVRHIPNRYPDTKIPLPDGSFADFWLFARRA